MSADDLDNTAGLEEAVARYGPPIERSLTYKVSKDFFQPAKGARKKRLAEVVILLRRTSGKYLVHTKAFYPPGTYRLLSGGIKPGEDLLAAVRRETFEETNLPVRIERFLGILRYRFIFLERSVPFSSYIFAVAEEYSTEQDGEQAQPSLQSNDPDEAITDYREVTLPEIAALADQLESLPPDWADWGRFRAAAHRLVTHLLMGTEDIGATQ